MREVSSVVVVVVVDMAELDYVFAEPPVYE